MRINLTLFLNLIIFLLSPFDASIRAGSIQARSCSMSDVQAAVNSASTGDTVVVPPGTCVWTGKVNVNDGIFIRGSGIDFTIIDWQPAALSNNAPFWIETSKPFGISDFTFKRTGTETDKGIIFYSGNSKGWRIHHNKFDNISMKAMIHWGDSSGLIDHNQFLGGFKGMDINGVGDASWERPWTPGSGDVIFIEDNVFDQSFRFPSVSCHLGGRYTFRYNTVTKGGLSTHGADSSVRGGGVIEAYGNTFTSDADHDRAIVMRGGTGIFFDNVFNGYTSAISLAQYRTCYGISWTGAAFENASRCDGSAQIDGNEARPGHFGQHNGSNSSLVLTDNTKSWIQNELVGFHVYNLADGSRCKVTENSATTLTCSLSGGLTNQWNTGDQYKITSGWPCKDQAGRGPGQTSEPIYQWNNSWSRFGGSFESVIITKGGFWCEDPSPADQIMAAQDYFDNLQRPSYTPYQYPHPLALEEASPSPPSPPSNLRLASP